MKIFNLNKHNLIGIPLIKNNYYELLGVESNCSPKEIRVNYLKIAKKYHPDKVPEALVNLSFSHF